MKFFTGGEAGLALELCQSGVAVWNEYNFTLASSLTHQSDLVNNPGK